MKGDAKGVASVETIAVALSGEEWAVPGKAHSITALPSTAAIIINADWPVKTFLLMKNTYACAKTAPHSGSKNDPSSLTGVAILPSVQSEQTSIIAGKPRKRCAKARNDSGHSLTPLRRAFWFIANTSRYSPMRHLPKCTVINHRKKSSILIQHII